MSEITPEFIESEIAMGKKYTMVFLKKGPNRDHDEKTANEIQMAHLKHLFSLRQKGILLINGPILDDNEIRGVGIYNLVNKDEVLAIASADPAVKAGRLVVEVHEWFGQPGASLK